MTGIRMMTMSCPVLMRLLDLIWAPADAISSYERTCRPMSLMFSVPRNFRACRKAPLSAGPSLSRAVVCAFAVMSGCAAGARRVEKRKSLLVRTSMLRGPRLRQLQTTTGVDHPMQAMMPVDHPTVRNTVLPGRLSQHRSLLPAVALPTDPFHLINRCRAHLLIRLHQHMAPISLQGRPILHMPPTSGLHLHHMHL